jgi:O-6-methylguanine DNA methyltransferase
MAKIKVEDIKCEQDVLDALDGYSEFVKGVYLATYRIPYGKVSTYQRVAKAAGNPKACRAAANALHNNPLFPAVPCWRVVKSDGGFGGEEKAAAGRRSRVEQEGVPIKDGRIVLSSGILH